jgi:hypothetical protein
MQVEQVKPNKPSFPTVVFLFGLTIILIFIAAVLVVKMHYNKKQAPPFTKHPVSQLITPAPARVATVA